MRTIALAATAFVAAPSTTTHAQTTELEQVAELRISAGVEGRFAEPVCEDGRVLEPAAFARVASALSAPTTPDGAEPVVLDTGSLLAPHGVALFAAENDAERYAAALHDLGYHALTFGENELGAPRGALLPVVRALRAHGVPMIASNLRCDEGHPLCEALFDAEDGVYMIERGDERIAVLTFLSPRSLRRVGAGQADGIRLAPVGPAMGLAVRTARERGATTVVAIVDDGWGAEAAARVLALSDGLAEEDKPDLVLASNAGNQLVFARPVGFRPAVAAAPPSGVARVAVRRDRSDQHLDVLVTPARPTEPIPAPVQRYMDHFGPRYCEAFGAPLPGGALGGSIDGDGLLTLAGQVAMARTDTEIALLNRGVMDRAWPGRDGTLRAADLDIAIQYDDPLAVATVSGRWIRSLARTLEDSPQLLELGITIANAFAANEKIKVNGRLLQLNGRYRVVTLSFLAAGGDGLLPDGADWEPAVDDEGVAISLRSATRAFLSRPPRPGAAGDPRERVSDPANRAQWTMMIDADLNFGGSAIRNPGGYDDTQLQRQNTAAFGMEFTIQGNALSPTFAWDNRLDLRYRLTRTPESGGFDEGDDRISYRTTALYRRYRVESGDWYMPQPLFDAYVESEFTAGREFHHLLVRPTVGVQFNFNLWLSLRATAGFEVETLAPDPQVQPGVGLHVALAPWVVMQSGLRKVIFAYTLDWFVSDLGGVNRRAIRANGDLSFALTTRFAIAMVIDLFGVREDGGDFSFASNVTASFRVAWLERTLR